MQVNWGSWRDPEVTRDVKILSGVGLPLVLAAIVPSGLVWVIAGPLALGALTALVMLLRRRPPALSRTMTVAPHRGINVSHISPAGFPGLVFAAGFIWMFWSGVPGFRPIVIGIALAGCLAGLVLVAVAKRHRLPTATPLGLSGTPYSAHHKHGPIRPR